MDIWGRLWGFIWEEEACFISAPNGSGIYKGFLRMAMMMRDWTGGHHVAGEWAQAEKSSA